jgi:hypothetical protein
MALSPITGKFERLALMRALFLRLPWPEKTKKKVDSFGFPWYSEKHEQGQGYYDDRKNHHSRSELSPHCQHGVFCYQL